MATHQPVRSDLGKYEDVGRDGMLRSRKSLDEGIFLGLIEHDNQSLTTTFTGDEDAFNTYPPSVTRHPPERLTPLLPPANFGAVDDHHIFRSSFPLPENFSFLKSLKLKTILTLVPEPFPPEYTEFLNDAGIQQIVVSLPANKDHVKIQSMMMHEALAVVMDRQYHPLLIHCNKGKHRTGCVVGSFRRVQGESISELLSEYHDYADPKARVLDEAFLKSFDEQGILDLARENGYATDEEGNVKNWAAKAKSNKSNGVGIAGAAKAAITSTVTASMTAVASAMGISSNT